VVVVGVELQLPAGSDPTGLSSLGELVAVRPGAPLSVRDVRRTLERLWRTGRFTDVVVREVPEGEGVRVVFVLTPRAPVVDLVVEGNQVLDDAAVLAAAGFTGRGRAEAAERLGEAERAVREAYAARGHDAARVAARAVPVAGGVAVVLEVEEGRPTRVAGVSFTGSPGLSAAELGEALGLPVGAVLDRTRVEEGLERLRALFRSQRFYTAQVDRPLERPAGPGGALPAGVGPPVPGPSSAPDAPPAAGPSVYLAVPVQAGPRFTFRFEGNRSLPDAQLLAALGYAGEEPLDATLVRRMVRRLTDAYRYRGFLAAEVGAHQALSPGRTRAVLTFRVAEDLPWRVREVRFEGREAVPEQDLRALLAEQLRARVPPTPGARVPLADPLELEGRAGGAPQTGAPLPPLGEVYAEEAYQEAAAAMTEAYRERGFLSAQVALEAVALERAGREVRVRFRVQEGPRTRVQSVAVEGAPEGFRPERVPTLAVGEPFSPAALERGRDALDDALTREGFLFADVQARPVLSPDGARVLARYRIQAGPRVRVGRVILEGNERSEPALLMSNVALREGDVLAPDRLLESQRALSLLGLFRQVAVRLVSPELVEPVKDVVVEVRERPRLEASLAGGYFFAEGPRVMVDGDLPNLWGKGYVLQGRGRLNAASLSLLKDVPGVLQGIEGIGGRGNLSFLSPRLLLAPFEMTPLQVGARVDLVGERTFRQAFNFTRYAAILGADVRTPTWLSVALQGELEFDDVQPKGLSSEVLAFRGVAQEQQQRYALGTFVLASARATATADFRDDPTYPRQGLLASGTAEVTRSLLSDYAEQVSVQGQPTEVRSAKLSGSVTGYAPVTSRAVLAASLRGGALLPLGGGRNPAWDSLTIPPRRFFLGGATSLRGFREDGLLPVEQRGRLAQERRDCRRLLVQAGCTAGAQLLQEGSELLSQGGDLFALAKLELRLPLVSALDVGLFAEAGNLWQRPGSLLQRGALRQALASARYVAGTGLRYVTPVGPVALDVGFNLAPDPEVNEQGLAVHFSIGLF
jgi:outer membrane protein assembly factor BamA